jgi:polyisoprenoid-binding protein YceI
MKFFSKSAASLCFILLAHNAFAVDAIHWQVLPEKSAIEWTATYGGKPLKGTFPDFTADIAFDPDHPEQTKVVTKIIMGKVKSDDKDAQENLPTSDWLSVSDYPVAVFEMNQAAHVANEDYTAIGTLTMRGKTVQVPLSFTVNFYNDNDSTPPTKYARVTALTTLKRLAFGIGQGDWAKTDAVADDVKVIIHMEAKQVP